MLRLLLPITLFVESGPVGPVIEPELAPARPVKPTIRPADAAATAVARINLLFTILSPFLLLCYCYLLGLFTRSGKLFMQLAASADQATIFKLAHIKNSPYLQTYGCGRGYVVTSRQSRSMWRFGTIPATGCRYLYPCG